MKKVLVVATALLCGSTYAGIIATTSFEAGEGFGGQVVNGGIMTTDNSGDYWEVGESTGNYAGIWGGASRTGSMSAVFGNYGNATPYFLANPAGADGIGSIDFWIVKTGNVDDSNQDPLIQVQWSLDGSSWTDAGAEERITNTLPGAGGPDQSGWANYNVAINQTGDVQVRVLMSGNFGGGSSHVSLDDVTITDAIPEPATFGLMAVFGGAVLLVRRKLMI